jgi:uncharacterized protein YkwD
MKPAPFCLELSALSRNRSRHAVLLLSALCLAALAALPPSSPVHLAGEPAATTGWLTRLNTWRANTGLPVLSEDSTWSTGDYDHSQYMVMNDLVTHYEVPGTPYYTTDGDTAARDGNIYVSSSTSTTDDQAIDWWMQAPFHAMGMMDPRLSKTGFGSFRYSKSGWEMGATLDVVRGNSFNGGQYPVYFPGNGTTEPLTSYVGGEFPDPLQACPGYGVPTGLPVFIQVGGNVSTVAGAHSFTGNGVALNHCVIDSTNGAVGSYLVARGGVILIPQHPLQAGVKYTVALTVNGVPYMWSFTVGPFVGCPYVTESAAPPSPSAVGTAITVTATATACANPLYEFWTLAPGATSWQEVQPYSTTASFAWPTTGLATGTYSIAVWARDAASSGLFGNSFGRWDSYAFISYTLQPHTCTGLGLSATPRTMAAAGTTVTFTATAACADPSPVYQFWLLAPGASGWTSVQAYSTANTWTWSTIGKAPGVYRVSAWVRDASSAGAYSNSSGSWDVASFSSYTVTTCTVVSLTSAPAFSAGVGTSVALTATAAGCPNPSPLYQFWLLAPGASGWTSVQAYSTANTWSGSTTGKAPGVYRVAVWLRDASSGGAYSNSSGSWDVASFGSYTVTTCTGVSLSSATSGTSVVFTARAAGCPNPSPVYEFWVLAPGASSWTLVQAYSTSNTWTWSTAGKATGTYQVVVWVRDAESAGASGNQFGTWDAYNNALYSLN